jgi:uncharacterized protein YdeI (YjbR/CyaY-like superfamily)
MDDETIFFETPEQLRAWFEEHHATASELWIGYYKKATGRPTLTWSQVVDEALCFGWIDGKVQRIDDERHRQRLTPRRPNSNWSAVNIAKVGELRKQGRMRPAGEAAFEARRGDRSAVYSYERRHEAAFDAEQDATFRVVSAKRPETRARRLATLIECSAEGRRVPPLTT